MNNILQLIADHGTGGLAEGFRLLVNEATRLERQREGMNGRKAKRPPRSIPPSI